LSIARRVGSDKAAKVALNESCLDMDTAGMVLSLNC